MALQVEKPMYPKKKMQRFSAAFLVLFCASAGGVEIDVELGVELGDGQRARDVTRGHGSLLR